MSDARAARPTVARRLAIPGRVALVLLLAVVAAGRALGGREPLLELVTHFRLQQVALAILLAVVLAVASWPLRRWADRLWLLTAVAAVLALGAEPLARRLAATGAPREGPVVTVLFANLLHDNADAEPLRALARQQDPDLLVLAEVDPQWARQLEGIDGWPHRLLAPRPGAFGSAVLSRWPLGEVRKPLLGPWRVPSLVVEVLSPEGRFWLVSTHPWPPKSRELSRDRDAHLAEAATLVRSLPGRVVLAGDLNVTPHSPSFRRFLDQSGLRDGRRGHGPLGTWPAAMPAPLRIPIDHVLPGAGVAVRRLRVGPRLGSDHLPLLAELAWTSLSEPLRESGSAAAGPAR